MYGIQPELTKEFILSKITEESIFERYLCPVDLIHKVCSPLRVDHKPTCNFYYGRNGSLLFIDPTGHFFGDCFEVVKFRFNCNFFKALEIIAKDFNLYNNGNNNIRNNSNINNQSSERSNKKYKEKSIISVKRQLWTETDVTYWKSYHLNSQILDKYNIASCKYVWLNGEINHCYSDKDPSYVYDFGNENYKIYFPLRENYRFIMNTSIIQGLSQLPQTGDYLIITKSLKDVLCLSLVGYNAIAPQSESSFISIEELNSLKKRFKIILIYFDNDRAGLTNAEKFSKEYNLKYITNSLNLPKDFSDFVKQYGLEKGKELITTLIHEKA